MENFVFIFDSPLLGYIFLNWFAVAVHPLWVLVVSVAAWLISGMLYRISIKEKLLQQEIVAWLLEFIKALGATWYIILGLGVLGYLMLSTRVGVNLIDYVLEQFLTQSDKCSINGCIYSIGRYIFLIVAMLTMALSSWLTPQDGFIPTKDWQERLKLNVYRYESALVFVLVCLFMDRILFLDKNQLEPMRFNLLITVLIFFFNFALARIFRIFYQKANKPLMAQLRVWTSIFALLSVFAVGVVLNCVGVHINDSDRQDTIFFINTTIQISLLMIGIWFWIFTYPIKKKNKPAQLRKLVQKTVERIPWYNWFFTKICKSDYFLLWRYLLLVVLYVIAVFFVFVPNAMSIPPLTTVLFGISFLIFNLDALNFSFEKKSFLWFRNSWAQLMVLIVSLVIVYLFFFKVTPSPVEQVSGVLSSENRPSFGSAFEQWVLSRQEDIRRAGEGGYTVYIVSGQGGGSRAGFWMCQSLLRLDSLPGLDFREHCFAISTVSGSSVGAAATLAFWRRYPSDSSRVERYQKYPESVFKGNFITGNLAGLFFSAPASKVNPWGLIPFPDRNQRRRREEKLCVARAMEEVKEGKVIWLYPNSKASRFDSTIMEDHFLSLYQNPPAEPAQQLPYFFPNTCHVQTGKRAVISPVGFRYQIAGLSSDSTAPKCEHTRNAFVQAQDFIRLASEGKEGPSLAMVANVSELFPLYSMAASTDTGGSYVDGGYYENYGLTTALEIYDACSKLLDSSCNEAISALRPNIRIVVLAINNAPDNVGGTGRYAPANQWTAPVSTVMNALFDGQTEYMREVAKDRLGRNFQELNSALNGDVPLTRLLTTRNMRNMDGDIKTQLKKILPFLEKPAGSE